MQHVHTALVFPLTPFPLSSLPPVPLWNTQTIYDAIFISLFNVIFTSLPVLALGALEQDVDDDASVKYPFLYAAGPRNILFNKKAFLQSLFRGFVHSFVVWFIFYLTYRVGDVSLCPLPRLSAPFAPHRSHTTRCRAGWA